ncbi:MAG: RraA family protein [Spirochaetes bacterium]|nr:RraA family protein [Spirochaetota bacterium]
MRDTENPVRLGAGDMLKLKRWNSPTVYNGWEAITRRDRLEGLWNRDEAQDFTPSLGIMVGRAVTVTIAPADPSGPRELSDAWDQWYEHVASIEGPKIIVMRDLGSPPGLGSFWGEVSANTHRALGCVGTIVDGAVRDIDEMTNAGFKALARRLCVGHLYAWPLSWGGEVEVFGVRIAEGTLIHADKHGFIGIPPEDEAPLLAAVRAMDEAECDTIIPAGRFGANQDAGAVLSKRRAATAAYHALAGKVGQGEW